MLSTRLTLLLALPALLTVACLGAGSVGPRPELPEVSGAHHLGSPLSGAIAGLHSAPPLLRQLPSVGAGLVVTGASTIVRAPADAGLSKLQAQASMIVAPLLASPLRVNASLLAPLRLGLVDDPYAWLEGLDGSAPLQEVAGLLEAGTTYTLRITHDAPEGAGQLREYELALSRPHGDQPLEVSLACGLRHSEGHALAWEQAMLDAVPDVGGRSLVVLAPTASPEYLLVMLLSVVPVRDGPGLDEHDVLAESARREVESGWRERIGLLQSVTATFTGRPDLVAGLSGLNQLPSRRASLLYLADSLGAAAAGDVALIGRTDLIDRLAVQAELGLPALAADDLTGLHHLLESAALTVLAGAVDAGEGDLVMDALLIRHAGELGRQPARLLELVEQSSSSADLNAALIAENRLFLEDNAPSARVRAYDWLLVHGIELSGYDPLGDRASRRAALARGAGP